MCSALMNERTDGVDLTVKHDMHVQPFAKKSNREGTRLGRVCVSWSHLGEKKVFLETTGRDETR